MKLRTGCLYEKTITPINAYAFDHSFSPTLVCINDVFFVVARVNDGEMFDPPDGCFIVIDGTVLFLFSDQNVSARCLT